LNGSIRSGFSRPPECCGFDWNFSWFGPAIGLLVFATWIAMDKLRAGAAHDALPPALANTSATIRATWIVCRTLSAIVAVPIAEELAFRGLLIRRLVSPDFETLSLRAWALVRRGQIGEAVIAHATTDALLASYVLIFQKWHLR
jgi:membrane protease YdiL (CAAX protease family)